MFQFNAFLVRWREIHPVFVRVCRTSPEIVIETRFLGGWGETNPVSGGFWEGLSDLAQICYID
ncbi:hypothetical protein AP285_26410 [Limnospira platensis YZ]|nr:hypothetical protein [Arthrospira sp. PLM2.Bin9]AMW30936.1 hypothetical protein AP285_26410 [Arthrospira platensis YZ]TVU55390.1 MAG: hypothetical protein EA414_02035 [Arthrospira sp. PLM2.Bin9]BAI93783.1 hypothetical protein NIES39_O05360 [Arthrospira platensis NIES-39]